MVSPSWYGHLNRADQEEFEQSVIRAKRVLSRLKDIIEKDYRASDKAMHKRDNFFMPAWAEKQAYELGYQKFAMKVIKLLEV